MNNFDNNKRRGVLCSLPLGSMTQAIKARRALAGSDITVTVKKLSTGDRGRGCIYGIEYPCEISGNVRAVLVRNGVGGLGG